MKTRTLVVAGLFACSLFLVANIASAEVLGIDTTVTDPVLSTAGGDDATITSFTVGTSTYGAASWLEATSIGSYSDTFRRYGNPDSSGDSVTAREFVANSYLTQGVANAWSVDYEIGQTLDADDSTIFYMYELVLSGQDGDDVTVYPLSGGSPIGSWSLTIDASDYGAQTDTFKITYIGSTVAGRGVTFSLADFTGDTGTLTGVDGLRFADSGHAWDPLAVGVAVPEPGCLVLLLSGVAALWIARRRRSA